MVLVGAQLAQGRFESSQWPCRSRHGHVCVRATCVDGRCLLSLMLVCLRRPQKVRPTNHDAASERLSTAKTSIVDCFRDTLAQSIMTDLCRTCAVRTQRSAVNALRRNTQTRSFTASSSAQRNTGMRIHTPQNHYPSNTNIQPPSPSSPKPPPPNSTTSSSNSAPNTSFPPT
jgi:hypothetical protein